MPPYLVLSGYAYVPLTDLKPRRAELLALCKGWNVTGSIVLSPEGINLLIAGEARQAEALLAELRRWPGLECLQLRTSGSPQLPLRRMQVRIKKEIVAFGIEGIDPARDRPRMISSRELRQWLDDDRAIAVLDVRNEYEVRLGTFEQAVTLGIEQFQDFPEAVRTLPERLRQTPVVVVCTSGIRAEKAALYLTRIGFDEVRVLEGGILDYLETCGKRHFVGECFAFDRRFGHDAILQPRQWLQCSSCRTPLAEEDQSHPHYEPGKSCPYCYEISPEQMSINIARRHERLSDIIDPLPGSRPRDHFRPITIPPEYDGGTLLDALSGIVAHIPRGDWAERCAKGLLVDDEYRPVDADTIVRAGERYFHKFPALVEPDVNMRVQVLYEDESLVVVNKPAPLPMHAGGRFHRNTLKYVLDALYHPQHLRPAHRLDANTTGALVVARTRYAASKIQPQFARGEVHKVYLVRVQGHPAADEFNCSAPISAEAGHAGSRVVDEAGLPARTGFRVLARYEDGTALLEARPRTGRTNQIRVHLWHLEMPVCGDPAYLPGRLLGDVQTLDVEDPPLCLHAWRISFWHPLRREKMTLTAPEPSWVTDRASVRDASLA